MAEMKNAKYIQTDYVNFFAPPPAEMLKLMDDQKKAGKYVESTPLFGLDSSVIKDSFIVSCTLLTRKNGEGTVNTELAHTHDFDEVWVFVGTDTKNPHDLGGELDFWLEDDHFLIDKSCMVFVPRGMKRGPCGVRRIDRPIMFFQAANASTYGRTWEGKAEQGTGKK